MSYKKLLLDVRLDVPVRRYPVQVSVQGNLPAGLSLPIFGSENGEITYLNSGGRGFLVPREGKVYRIKGADPTGFITKLVASSQKNQISDTRTAVRFIPSDNRSMEIESALSRGEPVEITTHQVKPFSFLSYQATQNSRSALEALQEGYEARGFAFPCQFAAIITYPNIKWHGDMVYSLVFELPDEESDLRLKEFERLMYPHLQHASPQDLAEIRQDFIGLYADLIKWYAFDSRILAKNGLFPEPASMLDQNHVLGHVGDGFGLSRVDHTSTTHYPNCKPEDIKPWSDRFLGGLYAYPMCIMQGIDYADADTEYDRDRFSGLFDAAFKFHGRMDSDTFPKSTRYAANQRQLFEEQFENPEPEPLSDTRITRLVDRVREIKINEEFETRRQERYASLRTAISDVDVPKGLLSDDDV